MKPAIASTIAAIGMAVACSHALAQNVVKEGEKVLLEGAKSQSAPNMGMDSTPIVYISLKLNNL